MPALPQNPKALNGCRAMFVIHQFEVKDLTESAGFVEVARPMIESGLLSEHKIVPLCSPISHARSSIKGLIDKLQVEWGDKPVVIYGAGAHTSQFKDLFSKLNIVAVADRNKELWGQKCCGLPIISPDDIEQYAAHVLISSRAYEQSILKDLANKLSSETVIKGLYEEIEAERDALAASLIDKVLDFNPDVLVYTPTHPHESLQSPFFIELKQALPELKIVNVWWDYDEQALESSYLSYERDCLRYSDFVVENSNATRLDKMKRKEAPYDQHTNIDKVHFHPTIFDSELYHKKDSARDNPQEIDIAIWGSIVGDRKKWIDLLQERFYDRFKHIGGVYGECEPLPSLEYASSYHKVKIAVNTQTYPFRSQCKGKVREALCSGTFLLEEDNPQTRAFVPEGKGVIYFSGEQDLINKIDYYLNHPQERKRVAQAGYEWIRAHHNAQKWTAKILDEVGLGESKVLAKEAC